MLTSVSASGSAAETNQSHRPLGQCIGKGGQIELKGSLLEQAQLSAEKQVLEEISVVQSAKLVSLWIVSQVYNTQGLCNWLAK